MKQTSNIMKNKINDMIDKMTDEEVRTRLGEYMMKDPAFMPNIVAIQVRLSDENTRSCRYKVLLVDEEGTEIEVKFRDRPSRLVYIYSLMHPEGYQRRQLTANNYRPLCQLYGQLYFKDSEALVKSIDKNPNQFISQAVTQARVAIKSTGLPWEDLVIADPKTHNKLFIPFVKEGKTVILDSSLR